MGYNYLETEEGKRRFENKQVYELSLKFQQDLKELGVAWHNVFSDECTTDFCCCCGDNLDDTNYSIYLPSYRSVVKLALEELFEITKHGDQEHQDWLENKFKEYLEENF